MGNLNMQKAIGQIKEKTGTVRKLGRCVRMFLCFKSLMYIGSPVKLIMDAGPKKTWGRFQSRQPAAVTSLIPAAAVKVLPGQ
jgi:hypothetical protein